MAVEACRDRTDATAHRPSLRSPVKDIRRPVAQEVPSDHYLAQPIEEYTLPPAAKREMQERSRPSRRRVYEER